MRDYKIIAICGPDGAGKTTLINQVKKNIYGKHIHYAIKRKHSCSDMISRYVDENKSEGEKTIRNELNSIGCAFDFLQYFDEDIRDYLCDDNVVICDRYSYCYLAYSIQIGETRNHVFSLLESVPHADLIVYVENEIDVLKERLKQKNEDYRDLEGFMAGYEALFKEIGVPVYRIKNDCFDKSALEMEQIILKFVK